MAIRFRTRSRSLRRGPLSQGGRSKDMSPGCMLIFGLAFLLPGLAVMWFLGIRPILKVREAQNWVAVPARVISSKVESHSSSDGTTYSVHIEYTYRWEDESFSASRYDFSSGSSSGYDAKARIVAQYPAGRTFSVWVNPGDPSEAVIDRKLKLFYFLLLGFGALFALVGSGISFGPLLAGNKRKKSPERILNGPSSSGALPDCIPEPPPFDNRGILVLKPDTGPWRKVAGTLFAALFWNGIISVFLYQIWQGYQTGHFPIFLSIFMIPFVLIGLILIGSVFYYLLATFTPRIVLLIGPGPLHCGGSYTLDWEFTGSTRRLHHFTLFLEGSESATYRQGTNSNTSSRVFYRSVLAERGTEMMRGARFDTGSVQLELPYRLPHSFKAPNNKIEWKLRVQGGIQFWPDLKISYPLVLLPFGMDKK